VDDVLAMHAEDWKELYDAYEIRLGGEMEMGERTTAERIGNYSWEKGDPVLENAVANFGRYLFVLDLFCFCPIYVPSELIHRFLRPRPLPLSLQSDFFRKRHPSRQPPRGLVLLHALPLFRQLHHSLQHRSALGFVPLSFHIPPYARAHLTRADGIFLPLSMVVSRSGLPPQYQPTGKLLDGRTDGTWSHQEDAIRPD
jgi:hypothetical protein